MRADHLRAMSLAELEETYRSGDEITEPPRGRFGGQVLRRLENDGARHPLWRGLEVLLFEVTPFGVDFDARRWFFLGRPSVATGSFEPRPGPSRWRPTTTVCLHYGSSRLPGPIRALLYDEVKPLTASLSLGIGGVNAETGRGDHFFFLLERL
jgi:hypothetical protein